MPRWTKDFVMDDLKERLREWWEYDPGHLFSQSLKRIEQLEARIAKADALAEVLRRTGYRVDHNGVTTITGIDAMIPINDALAAYREVSDT